MSLIGIQAFRYSGIQTSKHPGIFFRLVQSSLIGLIVLASGSAQAEGDAPIVNVESGTISAKGHLIDLRFDRNVVRVIEVQSRLISADARPGEIEFTFVETDEEGRALVLEHGGARNFVENSDLSTLRITAHEIHAQRDGYYALETRVFASSDATEIDAESMRYDYLRIENGIRTPVSEQEYDEATSVFANEYNGERVRRGSAQLGVLTNTPLVEAGRVARADEPVNKKEDERGQP